MAFKVEIKNIGKIRGESVLVGGLTVLAGPNNTGKSLFSKALYSVFDAMNANHALMHIQEIAGPLQHGLMKLEMSGYKNNPLWDSLGSSTKQLEETCSQISGERDEIAAIKSALPDLAKISSEIGQTYGKIREFAAKIAESDEEIFDQNSLKRMDEGVKRLGEISALDAQKIAFQGFELALRQNLIGNFQVPLMASLKKDAKQEASIEIEDVGKISIAGSDLEFDIDPAGLMRLQQYSRVIYLESPVMWKLRSALRNAHRSPYRFGRMTLSVPKYFIDLDDEFNREYSGEVAFPDLLQRLTTEVIRGQLVITETGAMGFSESGQRRSFSLPETATGVVNLGILALLIEQKIVDKGTFLFIDEPESNLHPQWQAEMIRALFDLAQGGVNVVIATHSSDIMERLFALVKQNPGSEKMVALNHFSSDGVVNGDKDFHEKMRVIQKELTDAFTSSYMEEQEQ